MNNRNNNLLHTGYQRATYDNDYDVSHMFHVSVASLHPTNSTFGVLGPVDPFGFRAYVPTFASPRRIDLVRVPSQPAILNPSRNTSIKLNNQQNVGLEKLRREIYNPEIQRRGQLYYRQDDDNSRREKGEDGKKCVICLDEFEPREMVTLTPCNHMFHDHCIVPWVKTHGQCPVCRFVIGDGRGANRSELPNDPFVRDLVSFIDDMEA